MSAVASSDGIAANGMVVGVGEEPEEQHGMDAEVTLFVLGMASSRTIWCM